KCLRSPGLESTQKELVTKSPNTLWRASFKWSPSRHHPSPLSALHPSTTLSKSKPVFTALSKQPGRALVSGRELLCPSGTKRSIGKRAKACQREVQKKGKTPHHSPKPLLEANFRGPFPRATLALRASHPHNTDYPVARESSQAKCSPGRQSRGGIGLTSGGSM